MVGMCNFGIKHLFGKAFLGIGNLFFRGQRITLKIRESEIASTLRQKGKSESFNRKNNFKQHAILSSAR